MTIRFSTAVSVAALLTAGTPASAKEYNIPKHIPVDSQAMVNRIYAEASALSSDTEGFNSFERDCSTLAIGANADGRQPDSQIIIADKIINAGGTCRMFYSTGAVPVAGLPPGSERGSEDFSIDGKVGRSGD